MQHVHSKHAPGTVVITAASLARYAEFWLSVEALLVPHGTRLIAARGADIPQQLNEGVRKMTGEWCWFLGDDHTFDKDILLKLLDHELNFVLPVVPRRDPPFVPVLMHGPVAPKMRRYSWSELPTSGLYKLPLWDSAGQAGALVKKPVLDRLGDPWFEGGQMTPGRLMEDMYFVHRMHALGVEMYVDCDVVMGHIANITITPQKHKGRWYPGHITKDGPVLWDEPESVGWGEHIYGANADSIKVIA
jgi:hypothetical protein